MNSYNNKNELIINEFFDKLAKALKYHSQNVRQFFEEETGKINVFSFKEKLKKLGYNEDKVEEVNILTNKFIKRLAPTIVDLDIIENELNLYQNRNSMGDSFSNIPVVSNLKEKIGTFNMSNNQNFNETNNLNNNSNINSGNYNTNNNLGNNGYSTNNNFGNPNNEYNTNNMGYSTNNNFGNPNNEYNTNNNFGNNGYSTNNNFGNPNNANNNLGNSGYSTNNNFGGTNSGINVFDNINDKIVDGNETFKKINFVKNKMDEEIRNYPPFVMVNIYNQLKKKQTPLQLNTNHLYNSFVSKDPQNTGLVNRNDFFNIIREFYITKQKEEDIIVNELNNNNPNYVPYQTFCESVKNANENDIKLIQREFNMKNNPYIVNMRKYVHDNNININDNWGNVNQGKTNISNEEFIHYLENGNIIDNNNPLEIQEMNYIFEIISPNGNEVSFKEFEKAMNEREYDTTISYKNGSIGGNILNQINEDLSSLRSITNDQIGSQKLKQNNTSSLRNNTNNQMGSQIPNQNNTNNQNQLNSQMNENTFNIQENSMKNVNFEQDNNISYTQSINPNQFNSQIPSQNIQNQTQSINQSQIPSQNIQNQTQNINQSQIPQYESEKFIQVRSNNRYQEINSSDPNNQYFIVQKRIIYENNKIMNILKKHQKYTLFTIYYQILNRLGNFGEELRKRFAKKDPSNKLLISKNDFYEVLIGLNYQIETDDFNLVLNALNSKTQNLYNYEEFLRNVFNIQQIDNGKTAEIYNECNLQFNDYIYDFRHYVKDNNINYKNSYARQCSNVTVLNYEIFKKFINEIQYNLPHEEELKYLFNSICGGNYRQQMTSSNLYLNQPKLFELFEMEDIKEEDFIKKGKVIKDPTIKTDWKKNIKRFTEGEEGTKELYKKNYKQLEKLFYQINDNCIRYGIENLIDYFDNSNEEITQEGDIVKVSFINLMNNIGITSNLSFENLLNSFSYNIKGPKKHLFRLAEFLSIYFCFIDDRRIKITNNIEPIKKEPEINVSTKPKGNYVYKNAHRQFTQDDIDHLSELCNFIADIIIDEKGMSITDFFNNADNYCKGFISMKKLKKIFRDDLEIDIDSDNSMDDFFDMIIADDKIEGEDIAKIKHIINVIKTYSGKDKPSTFNQTNKQSTINQNTNNQNTINQNTINQNTINQNNQNTTNLKATNTNNRFNSSINDKNNITQSNVNEPDKILKNFSHTLFNNKFAFKDVFPTIQDNAQNQTISAQDLERGFQKVRFPLSYQELDKLMIYFDPNSKRKIEVEKLKNEIKKYEPNYFNQSFQNSKTIVPQKPINTNTQIRTNKDINDIKLNETIVNNIDSLFTKVDSDNNNTISVEEFLKCLKSVNYKATKHTAETIIDKYDKNGQFITRENFKDAIGKYIKEQTFINKDEREYIKKLFRNADIDNNGYLTEKQLRFLMKSKLQSNLSEEEIEMICKTASEKYDGIIDIDEFVNLLDSINKKNDLNETEFNNPLMNEALNTMNISLNHFRNIQPKTFISLYDNLPLTFTPSFIREEQKLLKLLPSSVLKPKKSKGGIFYEDIDSNKTSGKKTLSQINTKINCKISFLNYATGVPSPDENLFNSANSQLKIVGRLLKIALFDTQNKCFIGNAISIDCEFKKEYSDRWYFEDNRQLYNNNIIIRYDDDDLPNISVIFEFVLVIQKKVDNIPYTFESSCGFSQMSIQECNFKKDEKLDIRGGSPSEYEKINPKDVKTTRIGFIPKLSSLFSKVESKLNIRIKPFSALNAKDKKYINFLPKTIVCHRAALIILSIYRKLIGEKILNHPDYLIKPIEIEGYILTYFYSIVDCPDAFRMMVELYNEIIVNSNQYKESDYPTYFSDYVKKIGTVLYSEDFKFDNLDPTKVPRGNITDMENRNNLINSIIRNSSKNNNPLNYKIEDVLKQTRFIPFSVHNLKNKKINIANKLDEVVPNNENESGIINTNRNNSNQNKFSNNQNEINRNQGSLKQTNLNPNKTILTQTNINPNQTNLIQTNVNPNQTKVNPNQTNFNQTNVNPNQTNFNQTKLNPNQTNVIQTRGNPNNNN